MSTTTRTGVTTYRTPSELEIQMTRVVDAPRELVFEAYTKPEHLRNWMLGPAGWTMDVCDVDLRPGGRQRFVWTRVDGTEMEICGEYREIDPPSRLVSTESWGGDWPEMINTLLLLEEDGRTIITTTLLFPSREARDAALDTGMKGGVDQSFERLATYLARLAA